MRKFLSIALIIISMSFTAIAGEQAIPKTPSPWGIYSGWLTVGTGPQVSGWFAGLVAGTITFNKGPAVTARWAATLDKTGHRPLDDFTLMIGQRFSLSRYVVVTGVLGPAYSREHYTYSALRSDRWTNMDDIHGTAGLAGEIDAAFPLFERVAALGVSVFGNANPRRSYLAGALTLNLGYIR